METVSENDEIIIFTSDIKDKVLLTRPFGLKQSDKPSSLCCL